VGKKSLAAHEPALRDAEARLARARATLLQLADEDGLAYQALNEVQRLPEADPRRARELPGAARACVQVPLMLAGACAELLRLFKTLAPIINPHLRSDLAIAAVLAEATARASWHNVAVNAGLMPDADRDRALDQARTLVDDCRSMSSAVEALCRGG
jgi:formiminotetrahydrofolate cyclodeaminase